MSLTTATPQARPDAGPDRGRSAIADAITLDELSRDPYPAYRRLRQEAPVAWLPAANRFLVTTYDDVMFTKQNQEIFSSAEENSLMTRVMGHTLMRKDGDQHQFERRAAESSFRPGVVKKHWMPLFEANTDALIKDLLDSGDGSADLFPAFAGPLAARNLSTLLGLRDVSDEDLQVWSQAMMDGTGNYADDPAVWARSDAAAAAIDAAIDEVVPFLRANPDPSVISSMLQVDGLTLDNIRANVKVIIGGGLNEPRDAVTSSAYAVLADPVLRAEVTDDPGQWRRVFEEAVRWIAPIGMNPRQVTEEVTLGGVTLQPGDRLGISLASANRDDTVFENPDDFDIHRTVTKHIAFGGGPHFCLGTWVARAQVAQIGLPRLFEQVPTLQLASSDQPAIGGWVFRGLLELPVTWS